ncbi:unnamed protein product [Ectocarpus sp. CCAP 1310/34]|nr:unnamed protein product [Ectocarpus sp. CCAP 1310/34]
MPALLKFGFLFMPRMSDKSVCRVLCGHRLVHSFRGKAWTFSGLDNLACNEARIQTSLNWVWTGVSEACLTLEVGKGAPDRVTQVAERLGVTCHVNPPVTVPTGHL